MKFRIPQNFLLEVLGDIYPLNIFAGCSLFKKIGAHKVILRSAVLYNFSGFIDTVEIQQKIYVADINFSFPYHGDFSGVIKTLKSFQRCH
jgi:hypothetical protein